MRKAGVLLHISTLPGPFGCGTFGQYAYRFADFLAESGFSIWQVLPFNIPCRDACPYSSVSTFAQNPLFIDPALLEEQGLLTAAEVEAIKQDAAACVGNYYKLAKKREKYLRRAARRFAAREGKEKVLAYIRENPRIREACKYLSRRLPTEKNYFYYCFLQYIFFVQWKNLHTYLKKKGIEVIGDIPIYADYRSSEVYYNRECFLLNKKGIPEFVSGVPGDDFNDAGQKWCHPLYNTEAMKKQNYSLLFDRMAFASQFYDVTRIDHFQAIAMFYAIPLKGHPREGHWEVGVGEPFVKRLVEEIGKDRFVVEDFGGFPGNSRELAKKYGFPDMRVLQFTLCGERTAAGYPENTVAYLGTHDNSTFRGFLDQVSEDDLPIVAKLLGDETCLDKAELCKKAIASLLASPAERTVFQVQDLLLEDNKSRMNIPGISGHGNWLYRITEEKLAALEAAAPAWRQLLSNHNRTEG